jgi:hypothetical protein
LFDPSLGVISPVAINYKAAVFNKWLKRKIFIKTFR